jgi:poly(3-hydroxybutyrate) depolymerase
LDQGSATTTATPPPTTPPLASGTNGSGGQKGWTSSTCGTRPYRLYAPSTYQQSQPTRLLIFFHGLGDDSSNFTTIVDGTGWRALADSQNVLLMVVEAQNPNRASFLFFDSSGNFDEAKTRAEAQSVLSCALDGAGGLFNIRKDGIYNIGFSEGAVFANYMAGVFPQSIRGAGIYSGAIAPYYLASNPSLPKLYFACGTADSSYSALQPIPNQWVGKGYSVQSSAISGVGHSFVGINSQLPPLTVWNAIKAP